VIFLQISTDHHYTIPVRFLTDGRAVCTQLWAINTHWKHC